MKRKFELLESLKDLDEDAMKARNLKPLQEKNLLELGKRLKGGHYKASEHIPFLQTEITDQLEFIHSHLTTQEQHNLFPLFQKEFEQRVENQNLTYEWWILFAYRLSILVTPDTQRQIWGIGRPLREDPFTKKNSWGKYLASS